MGADVNSKDDKGESILTLAFESEDKTILNLLTKHPKIEIDYKEVFFSICKSNNLDLVKLAIENGADVNQLDIYGSSPLMKAVDTGNLEIVKYLVENGADVSLKNSDNESALMIANENGERRIKQYLIDFGADEDDINSDEDEDDD